MSRRTAPTLPDGNPRARPDESLRRVVNDMAERRLGCAVVVERVKVVGVFTTIDALHRLTGLCDIVEMIARAG